MAVSIAVRADGSEKPQAKHQSISENCGIGWCSGWNNENTNESRSSPIFVGETPTNLIRSPNYRGQSYFWPECLLVCIHVKLEL